MSVKNVGMSPQIYKHMNSHTHEVWEIVLNLQGNGVTEIGGNCYPYEPGTIICQPPNIPHNKLSEEGFRDIYIQPTTFSLSGLAAENGVIIMHDDSEKSFETLIMFALRIFHKKESNYKLLLDSVFEAMNQLLLCWYQREPEEKEIEQMKNKLIHSFTDSEFSISELLKESPYCKDHLRRRFKKFTGCTPAEYLTQLRIDYAKKLIQENAILHYTIAEIGNMSGYYDSHYFSRIFKKNTGYTPSKYIEHVNKKLESVLIDVT